MEGYFARILDPSRAICAQAEYYSDPHFSATLDFIDSQKAFILAQPRRLYNQDIRNVMFVGNRCSGFFDLELSWMGTELMQLGSLGWLLHNAARQGRNARDLWKALVQGYGEARGVPLSAEEMTASRAVAQFLVWRDISRYGNWRGEALKEPENERESARQYADDLRLLAEVISE